MADVFTIEDVEYSLNSFYFHPELAPLHGMSAFAEGLSKTKAGEMGFGNHHKIVLPVIENMIKNGRKLRFQSFNNYRRWVRAESRVLNRELHWRLVVS